MEQSLLEKPTVSDPVKISLAFYRAQRFIIMFTRASYWFLCSARSTQSTPLHSFFKIHVTMSPMQLCPLFALHVKREEAKYRQTDIYQ